MSTNRKLYESAVNSGVLANTIPTELRQRLLAAKYGAHTSDPISSLDPDLDLRWSKYGNSEKPHGANFDYYFTGQDILVSVEGADQEGCTVIEFGFNIQQQKVPVYGFWSFTFDAVMRGTRLVSGMIRIATKDLHWMTDQVAKAATTRAGNLNQLNPIRGLDKDESNIEKYWSRNINDDRSRHGTMDGNHLFSSHPPFNFYVAFNLQSVSLGEDMTGNLDELYTKYQDAPAEFLGWNERLVESGVDGTMAYLLENVEITGMETEMSPSGEPIAESYTFFARDITLADSK